MRNSQFIRHGSLVLLSGSLLFSSSAKAASSFNQQSFQLRNLQTRHLEQLPKVLIAQSSSQVTRAIQESYGRIKTFSLELAKQYSPSSLEWRDADVEFLESQGVLKVTLYGRAPALIGNRTVRLTLSFQADDHLNFQYRNDVHLYVSRCGKMRPACKRRRRRAFYRIEGAINKERGMLENKITNEAHRLLSS